MAITREKAQLMSASEIDRTLVRLAHEILEKTKDLDQLAFIGIRRRGVPLAQRLSTKIESLESRKIPVGILDINLYRDDLSTVDVKPVVSATEINFSVAGKDIILMDDVLYTGARFARTRRAVRSWPAGARETAGADRSRPSGAADRGQLHRAHGADHRYRNHRSEVPGDRRYGEGASGEKVAGEAA